MKWAESPGFKALRFDTELGSFGGLMSLFLSTPDRLGKTGKKVIASGPLSPLDPIYAAGAAAYDVVTHETIVHGIMQNRFSMSGEAVNAGLSADFNAWNLMSAGAVISKNNEFPIDAFSTACGYSDDQIKKTWQIMADTSGSPLHFWDVPRFDPGSVNWARDFLIRELKQFFLWLTSQTGQKINDESLRQAITLGNLVRQDMVELDRFQQQSHVAIPALEYHLTQAIAGDYAQDAQSLHNQFQVLLAELKVRANRSPADSLTMLHKPFRLYWVGEDTQEFQIFNIIEDCGGALVGCDTRFSLYYQPVREEGSPVENLAEWIWHMPSNLPTVDRMKVTVPHIRNQKPDGIIISNVTGSRNLPGAERLVRDIIKEELDLPVLSIETSLPLQNLERLTPQIKSFIETHAG